MARNRAETATTGSRPLAALYFVLAAIGLIATWYYNLVFVFAGDGSDGNYLQAWFANAASSSAAVDVIVTAVVASVFYVREGARLGRRWAVALVPLTFFVALAFTLPLFLGLRELRLAQPTLGRSSATAPIRPSQPSETR